MDHQFQKLSKGEIRYGLRLSTRGRVLADSFFFRLGEEEFLLVSRGCEGTEINSLLEENIVADEVEFSNESNDWELITVWGSKEELSTLFKEVNRPEKGNFVQFENGYLFEDFAISPVHTLFCDPFQMQCPMDGCREKPHGNVLKNKGFVLA